MYLIVKIDETDMSYETVCMGGNYNVMSQKFLEVCEKNSATEFDDDAKAQLLDDGYYQVHPLCVLFMDLTNTEGYRPSNNSFQGISMEFEASQPSEHSAGLRGFTETIRVSFETHIPDENEIADDIFGQLVHDLSESLGEYFDAPCEPTKTIFPIDNTVDKIKRIVQDCKFDR